MMMNSCIHFFVFIIVGEYDGVLPPGLPVNPPTHHLVKFDGPSVVLFSFRVVMVFFYDWVSPRFHLFHQWQVESEPISGPMLVDSPSKLDNSVQCLLSDRSNSSKFAWLMMRDVSLSLLCFTVGASGYNGKGIKKDRSPMNVSLRWFSVSLLLF